MKTLHLDFLHSLRTLAKNPGYALVAILLFALGIGANTAIFSVANSVLLRPLPYAQPDRLVVALHEGVAPVSPADFVDYQKSTHAFDQMAAAQVWGATLAIGDRREQIPGIQITPNMIGLLGVPPMLGHGFGDNDDNVLLISYGLWKDRFGGDPAIIGRAIQLDRATYTVVGVMPSSFRFAPFWATRAQMWAPLNMAKLSTDRDSRSLRIFARLKNDVSLPQAQAEMDAVAAHLAAEYPKSNAKLGISLVPLHEKVVNAVRPTLLALLGTVSFVLLIACATVGNLMLSRSVGRRKEMALRLAVGARHSDLVRITMAEVLVLAALGAAGGLLLGSWAMDILGGMLPSGSIPRQSELSFDGVAVAFGAAAALLSALLAGILPSVQATRANLNSDLKDGGRGSTHGAGHVRSQHALIAAEVALSLLLMAGAGLMMRTMAALSTLDGGFNPHNLLTMQVSVSGTDYDRNERRSSVFRAVRERLASNPQIEAVSAINHLPLGGDMWGLGYRIEGRPAPPPGTRQSAVYRVVMPGYMQTMQLGLLEGREFNDYDNEHSSLVAVINEAMAKRQFAGSPLGQVIHYGVSTADQQAPRTIVGVVRNARQGDWTSAPDDEIYVPYFQRPDSMGLSYMTFVVRTRGASEAVAQDVRSFNKMLTISEVVLMDRVISDQLWRQRLAATLISAFAGVALLLAAAGIYGVISHSMRQRASEIGIRMALGAKSSSLIRLTLLEGMRPVLVGLAAGTVGALALTHFLKSLLYGVEARDASTFMVIVGILSAVSVAANLIPAFRATRVDPVIALRHD